MYKKGIHMQSSKIPRPYIQNNMAPTEKDTRESTTEIVIAAVEMIMAAPPKWNNCQEYIM